MKNTSTGSNNAGNTAYRDPTAYIVGGIFGACIFALVLYFPLFNYFEASWHKVQTTPYSEPFKFFSGWQMLEALFLDPKSLYLQIIANNAAGILDIFLRLTLPVFVSFGSMWLIIRSDIKPQKTEFIGQGKAVESNSAAFKKTAGKRLKKADGIKIHADVRIQKSRESEHILIAGATGAGKSQALTHIISSVLERKDRAIIFDIKGDYTAQLVSHNSAERKAQRICLVAPWDERGIQWNIAADISGKISAQSFAEAFIPHSSDGKNSYFTDAAQDVLAGCIEYLYTKKPKLWGWKDLQHLLSNVERISAALESIEHAAAQHIQLKDGGASAQTQGVLGSLRAPLKSLDVIAKFWSETGGASLVNGFMKEGAKGTLILAARPDMQAIATPLIAGLLALLMQKGLSLSDSKERRIWFIIDELGALPKISKLVDFITLARSKGMCLVAGIQDLGRLYSKYGKDETTTIASQFGTHLIGRLGDSDTAKWAADLFGQQRIERLQISESQQNASVGLTYQPSVSTTWQQSDKGSLIDSDFLHLDKATKGGFYMWCRLTDDKGSALLGKLHYKINPVPTPFSAHVEKQERALTPVEKAAQKREIIARKSIAEGKTKAPENTLRKIEAMAKVISRNRGETEEKPEAVIDNQEQQAIANENETAIEGGGDLTAEVGRQALGVIAPGLDIALDVSEALSSETINEGAGNTQQTSKKRKRKLRFRRKDNERGGIE